MHRLQENIFNNFGIIVQQAWLQKTAQDINPYFDEGSEYTGIEQYSQDVTFLPDRKLLEIIYSENLSENYKKRYQNTKKGTLFFQLSNGQDCIPAIEKMKITGVITKKDDKGLEIDEFPQNNLIHLIKQKVLVIPGCKIFNNKIHLKPNQSQIVQNFDQIENLLKIAQINAKNYEEIVRQQLEQENENTQFVDYNDNDQE